MDAHEELVLRLAEKRRRKLDLSSSGYAELVLAVREDPAKFVDDPAEEAFSVVTQALGRYEESHRKDDFLSDEDFMAERKRRLERMREDCERALAVDDGCTDARLLSVLARDEEPDALLDLLLDIEKDIADQGLALSGANAAGASFLAPDGAGSGGAVGTGERTTGGSTDAWTDVFARPYLRVQAAVARTCLDTARYRMANAEGQRLLSEARSDVLGARHTCALALARLEDEEGFDELDSRYGRFGDSWTHLGRVILLYKLGRMGAARRALAGFDNLCEGGIYALLRPVMADTYMPDRPLTRPYSFEEATLAVHEADPIVVDVPDLPAWAEAQPGMRESAMSFARKSGFDW
ncbi:MAG: hypothetical protein J6D54_02570 [Olsenella sp.]|nr:hypothetical protein [Olsenella sp.]